MITRARPWPTPHPDQPPLIVTARSFPGTRRQIKLYWRYDERRVTMWLGLLAMGIFLFLVGERGGNFEVGLFWMIVSTIFLSRNFIGLRRDLAERQPTTPLTT